jgi:hypothetical protein
MGGTQLSDPNDNAAGAEPTDDLPLDIQQPTSAHCAGEDLGLDPKQPWPKPPSHQHLTPPNRYNDSAEIRNYHQPARESAPAQPASLIHSFKTHTNTTMTEHRYAPLLLPNSIRLLRLSPKREDEANIRCHLFECPLEDSTGKPGYPYEALSYTWGSSVPSYTIFVNDQKFHIGFNLNAALLARQDFVLPRIMWIDAICIDQSDTAERGQQVRLMGKIFANATIVVVWLGEAEDESYQALEALQLVAHKSSSSPDLLTHQHHQQALVKLLRRPWFRRVWVRVFINNQRAA